MEDNNQRKPDVIVDRNGKGFRPVNFKGESNNKGFDFGKTVAVPFLCGVLGAGIVVGTCFGVPSIKQSLVGSLNSSEVTSTSASSSSNINTSQISLVNYSDTGIAVAQKILPSIVGITVEYPVSSIFMNQSTTATSSGSGIIVSEDGYILTNNHVVSSTASSSSTSSYYAIGEASKITIKLYGDNTEYEATVVGTDEITDLAVLKIDKNGLTAAELGSSDSLQVGEVVMAVGNPLGMQTSITSGIVSAVNTEITDSDGNMYTLIQTDAAINSGNSGGALVNSQGQVVGINNMKVSATGVEGMGFAIPIDTAKPIYEQLKTNGSIARPYIGISGRDLSETTAKANNLVKGIYVVTVEEYSAGEKAGIKTGDVIIKADGKEISTMNELNAIKNSHSIGDTMTINIYRNGQEKELTITLDTTSKTN